MARSFNGTTDVIAATITAVGAASDWTIAAWIKPASAGESNQGRIFEATTTGGVLRQDFRFLAAGRTLRAVQTFTTTSSSTNTTTTLTANVWQCVIATFRASDGKCRIYIGSPSALMAEASYASQTAGVGTQSAAGVNAWIGNDPTIASTFDGPLARVMLTAREWTADDMERFRLGFQPITSGNMRGYWPLDSPTLAQAEDLSGNGANGTVTGCTVVEGPPIGINWGQATPAAIPVSIFSLSSDFADLPATTLEVAFGAELSDRELTDTGAGTTSATSAGSADTGQPWEPTGIWGRTGNQLYVATTAPASAPNLLLAPAGGYSTIKASLPVVQSGAGVAFAAVDPLNYLKLVAVPGFATWNLYRVNAGVATLVGNTGLSETANGTRLEIRQSLTTAGTVRSLAIDIIGAYTTTATLTVALSDFAGGAKAGLYADTGLTSARWAAFSAAFRWTDISADVRPERQSLSTRRGKQHELDRVDAGVVSFTIDDHARSYDPTYTSSPYYPWVLPLRRVRVRAGQDVFNGYVERWPVRYPSAFEDLVEVQAVDAFAILRQQQGLSRYAASVLSHGPRLFYRFSPGDDSADEGPNLYDATISASAAASRLTYEPDDASINGTATLPTAGTIRGTGSFSISLIFTHVVGAGGAVHHYLYQQGATPDLFLRINAASAGYLAFCAGGGSGGGSYVDTSALPTDYRDGNTYWVVAVRDVENALMRIYVNGVQVASSAITTTYDITDLTLPIAGRVGTDLDEFSVFDYALSSAQITAMRTAGTTIGITGGPSGDNVTEVLNAASWPLLARSIDAGAETENNALIGTTDTPLALMQRSEVDEDGLLFMAADGKVRFRDSTIYAAATPLVTFNDDGTGVGYFGEEWGGYDVDRLYNAATVNQEGITDPYIARDRSSIARYGLRPAPSISTYLASPSDPQDRADAIVARFSTPSARIESLSCAPREDFSWGALLLLEEGDLVRVVKHPPGGGTITQDSIIVGIHHDQMGMPDWTISFDLQAV